jgi:hypothetical protein
MSLRMPLLVAAAVCALALGLVVAPAGRADAATTVNGPSAAAALTSTALASLGKFEGECFPFVQRVVKAVLGKSIGSDYRLGYLQAGAVEVTLAAAQPGDVIQLIDDRNTSPSADYPGMHTALVMENYGGGKFRVVDSNASYDGMVRVRDYEPRTIALRYPYISIHAYHLIDTPVPANGIVPPGASSGSGGTAIAPVPLTPGAQAVVAADGDCLRVRSVPALSGATLTCMPTGASLTIAGGAAEADGYKWLRISSPNGTSGWTVEQYLRGVASTGGGAASAAPAPVVAPSTTGKIVGGAIPASGGVGLVVYGGGSKEELFAASGCPKATAVFWASQDGKFVTYIPAATVAVVNAAWDDAFPEGIPAGTALVGRCS